MCVRVCVFVCVMCVPLRVHGSNFLCLCEKTCMMVVVQYLVSCDLERLTDCKFATETGVLRPNVENVREFIRDEQDSD